MKTARMDSSRKKILRYNSNSKDNKEHLALVELSSINEVDNLVILKPYKHICYYLKFDAEYWAKSFFNFPFFSDLDPYNLERLMKHKNMHYYAEKTSALAQGLRSIQKVITN